MPELTTKQAALAKQFRRDVDAEIARIIGGIEDLIHGSDLMRVSVVAMTNNTSDEPMLITLRIDPPDEVAMKRYSKAAEANSGTHHVQ